MTEEEPIRKIQESNLDSLWKQAELYRDSDQFKRIMEACAHFRTMAPYNAMLIEMQRPGARYVLTAYQWGKHHHRKIKPDARPLIILMPFGPVEFVFDIGDTMPINEQRTLFQQSEDEVYNQIAEPFRVLDVVDRETYNNLIHNLSYHGIYTNFNFLTGAGYGAKLELNRDLPNIQIPTYKSYPITRKASYMISVKSGAMEGQCFASICHELGHLFCHHLPMPDDWKEKRWETRQLEHRWKEFEAESVSWLVCRRLGIGTQSKFYLAGYFPEDGSSTTINEHVSIENILTATREIEQMLKPMNYHDGLLYKHCKPFQQECQKLKEYFLVTRLKR